VNRFLGLVALALCGVAAGAGAQDAATIARRVAAAPDGEVRMAYAARDGVVGDGRSVIAWDCEGNHCRHYQSRNWDGRDGWSWDRQDGPVRVALRVRDKTVVGMRLYVGGTWRTGESVTDLGMVPARAAAAYFIGLARQDIGRGASDAVFAAALADSVQIWRDLLALARDRTIRTDTRKKAIFWLGQEAEDEATRGIDSLIDRTDEEIEVRKAAVFALSQRRSDESVPALIRIARTNTDLRLRKQAMFWLAQTDDPRALQLFEDILTKK